MRLDALVCAFLKDCRKAMRNRQTTQRAAWHSGGYVSKPNKPKKPIRGKQPSYANPKHVHYHVIPVQPAMKVHYEPIKPFIGHWMQECSSGWLDWFEEW
jgi:hypothetical protein